MVSKERIITILIQIGVGNQLYILFLLYSLCLVKFANQGDQLFLIVGVAKEFQLNPRVSNGGFLYTYK